MWWFGILSSIFVHAADLPPTVEALTCGARPPLALSAFELEAFDRAKPVAVTHVHRSQVITVVLEALKPVAPSLADRLLVGAQAFDARLFPDPEIPSAPSTRWVPNGCAISPVLSVLGPDAFAVNTDLFAKLSPYDQAMVELEALWIAEAGAKAFTKSVPGQLVRLLFAGTPRATADRLRAELLATVGYQEYIYENGDAVFVQVSDPREFELQRWRRVCGFRIQNGPAENLCAQAQSRNFYVYSLGRKRVARILQDRRTVFEAPPTTLGLPADTEAYTYGLWEDGYRHRLSITFKSPRKMHLIPFRFTCPAGTPVHYTINSDPTQTGQFSLQTARILGCVTTGPVRFNWGYDEVEFQGRVSVDSGTYPHTLTVEPTKDKERLKFGAYQIERSAIESVDGAMDETFIVHLRSESKMQITVRGCRMTVSRLIYGKEKTIGASLNGPCTLKTAHGDVRLTNGGAAIDAETQRLQSMYTGAESYENKLTVRVLGQKFEPDTVHFDAKGEVLRMSARYSSVFSNASYFDENENRMITKSDSGYSRGLDQLCFNAAKKRLERPLSYADKCSSERGY